MAKDFHGSNDESDSKSLPDKKLSHVTSAAQRLCQPCLDIQIGQNETTFISRDDHPGFKHLRALRDSGQTCDLCQFLFEDTIKFLRSRPDVGWHTEISDALLETVELKLSISSTFASLIVFFTNDAARIKNYEVKLKDSEPDILPVYESAVRDVPLDPIHPESLYKMKSWLETCDREHKRCRKRKDHIFVPSRLLYVGSLDQPALRLSLDGSNDSDVPYIALSHCWGESQTFVLDGNKHKSFQSLIEESTMPKTFQDAVQIARLLGVQHVWIDSLCIKQDSREDWEVQSRQMGRIYENAYVTIAASRSPRDTHGFLKLRSMAAGFCGTKEIEGVRKDLYLCDELPNSSTEDPLKHEPLTSRGWALQERILSSRSIFFGSRQLIWRCREVCYMEDGRSTSVDQDRKQRENFWKDIVSGYSACSLTRPSDKLAALSGVADFIMVTFPDTYLAGHWLSNLIRSLVWSRNWIECHALSRIAQCHTPSWSWASRNGRINFSYTDDERPVAQLIDHFVRPLSQANPYGEVQAGGYLVISAPLARVELSVDLKSFAKGFFSATVRHGVLVDDDIYSHRSGLIALDDSKLITLSGMVFALIVKREDMEDDPKYYGILLVPRKGDKKCYERIGAVEDLELDKEEFKSLEVRQITLK